MLTLLLLPPLMPPPTAIRFVLNDAFAGVGAEERQKLLHVRWQHVSVAATGMTGCSSVNVAPGRAAGSRPILS